MLLFVFLFFWYLLVSVVTFFVYGYDKSRARKSAWRVKEQFLHRLEFFGGWPGAIVAQRVFKHKRRKWTYMREFYFVVVGHVVFWAMLLYARFG